MRGLASAHSGALSEWPRRRSAAAFFFFSLPLFLSPLCVLRSLTIHSCQCVFVCSCSSPCPCDQYDTLGAEFAEDSNVVIAKVDATENDTPAKVEGFPTLIFYPAGAKANPITYDGDRSHSG